MHKIGIDLGGTKTEGILLDEKHNIIERSVSRLLKKMAMIPL